jgi:PAS domain S-box-containing protein
MSIPIDEQQSTTIRIEIPPESIPSQVKGRPVFNVARANAQAAAKPSKSESTAGESKYQQLLQSVYDAVLITDLQGRIFDVNHRAEEFLLSSGEDLCKMNILNLISGAEISLIETLCQHLQKERFALIQAYCIRNDKSFFPAEIAVNLLKFEDTRLCFLIRDITLRKQAEDTLRTEHNALQNAGNGIAIANVSACLEYVNPAMQKLWACENAEEMLGRDVRELWQDRDRAEEMIRSILDDHQAWSGELIARRTSGDLFHVQVSAACNRDSEGELTGIVLSFADITDRKRAEEAMKEAERQKAMLATVGAACHHLGQPATVILANLGLMKRKILPNDHEFKYLMQMTTEAAEQLGQVLYELNTVSEYKTTDYLESRVNSSSSHNTILDIPSAGKPAQDES